MQKLNVLKVYLLNFIAIQQNKEFKWKFFGKKKKIYFNFKWNKREEKLAKTLRPFFLTLPFVVHKVKKIVDLMYYLLSFLSFILEIFEKWLMMSFAFRWFLVSTSLNWLTTPTGSTTRSFRGITFGEDEACVPFTCSLLNLNGRSSLTDFL